MDLDTLNHAIDCLSKDKLLKKLIDRYNRPIFIKNENYFNALVKSIIYQQISGKAAKSIYDRFQNLFQDKGYSPGSVLALQDSQLREAGLSKQKVSYIKNQNMYVLWMFPQDCFLSYHLVLWEIIFFENRMM